MRPFAHPRGTLRAFREHLNATITPGDPGAEGWQAARPDRPFGDWLYVADRAAFGARLRKALASGRWKFVRPAKAPTVRKGPKRGPTPATVEKARRAAELREGRTLEEVGAALGVTRERVRQLLAVAGVTPPERVRHECQRPGCHESALEYCCGCRRTAKAHGIQPGELPPVGVLPRGARFSKKAAIDAAIDGR